MAVLAGESAETGSSGASARWQDSVVAARALTGARTHTETQDCLSALDANPTIRVGY